MSEELEQAIIEALGDRKLRAAIKRIIEFEEEIRRKYPDKPQWWEWEVGDVGIEPWTIVKLLRYGIVERVYASSKHRYYRLRDFELTKKLYNEYTQAKVAPEAVTFSKETKTDIPRDLFEVIVGFDDIKKVLLKSIRRKRHHVLLVGPPATAKTLFLLEIARLPGAYYVLGGQATKVGIIEILLEAEPRYLLIDELDKFDRRDLSALLSLMETGIVKVTKHGKHFEKVLVTNVYAAANTIRGLPPELLSRFMIFNIPPYDTETLEKVMVNVLVKREGKDPNYAKEVAKLLIMAGFNDVRDAIKIARIADTIEEAKEYIYIWKKYRKNTLF